jgi:phosphatidylglycerol:prolipoprotein diacylglycerol transferase
MLPVINIFGREIPTFGMMVLLGFGAGALITRLYCKIKRINSSDPILTGLMGIVGAVIGAWLLKPLIRLPDIIINWDRYSEIPVGVFFGWLFGEMVFYGGLLGGIAAAFLFCRSFKIPFMQTADTLAPAIPLGHAFGRIGCLLGGCCYGMQVSSENPFAVVYRENLVAAPGGIPLLAVPVIEGTGNLIIAAIVFVFGVKKERKSGNVIALYGILYGLWRFIIEFFRGDLMRGVYGGISTSQFISMGIIVVSVFIFIKNRKKEILPIDKPEKA